MAEATMNIKQELKKKNQTVLSIFPGTESAAVPMTLDTPGFFFT